MMEDGGRWRKTTEDGGRWWEMAAGWWKMAEDGGRWRRISENGGGSQEMAEGWQKMAEDGGRHGKISEDTRSRLMFFEVRNCCGRCRMLIEHDGIWLEIAGERRGLRKVGRRRSGGWRRLVEDDCGRGRVMTEDSGG